MRERERARVARRVRAVLDGVSPRGLPLPSGAASRHAETGREAEVARAGWTEPDPQAARPPWTEPDPQAARPPWTEPEAARSEPEDWPPSSSPDEQVPGPPIVPGAGSGSRHAPSPLTSGISGWLRARGLRIDPGHRGALAMAVAAALAALVAGWWVLAGRPHSVAVSSSAPPTVGPSARSSVRATSTALVVDVVGKVRHPGLLRLRPGSRVGDALHAAGGALPGVDLTSLNLARKVIDGEQLAVGVPGAAAAGPPPPPGSSAGAAAAPVDLNSSTVEQLEALPGVGPVLAQHIVDWRTAHGRFDSVDQLREVSGIGPSRFADLKALVTV